MPRSGLGVFTAPFPPVVEGTTIESTVHNGTVSDFVTDANAARPITAGGTGATSAAAARTALNAEVAGAQVTNYDSHVFEAGSFWSDNAATGEPVDGSYFTGICTILGSSDNIHIVARNHASGLAYVRTKTGGTWGAWTLEGDDKVSVAGDTMTGNLYLGDGITGQKILSVRGNSSANQSPVLELLKGGTGSYQFSMEGGSLILSNNPASYSDAALSAAKGFTFGSNSLTVAGAVSVGSTLGVTGAATVSGGLTIAAGGLGVTGGATFNNTLNVTGAATFSSTLGVAGRANISSGIIEKGSTGYGGSDLGLYSGISTNYIRFVTNGGNFVWSTDNTGSASKMALDSSGNLTVSQGITANTLYLQTGATMDPTITFDRAGFTALITHSGVTWNFYSNAGKTAGMMMAVNSSAWTAISDARMPYKKSARDITDRLPPLDHYRLYENANGSGIPEVFAKAQEVDGLFPQLVHRGSDDLDYEPTGMSDPQAWGLSYDRMGAIALAYIKQLTARIEELERRLNAKPS